MSARNSNTVSPAAPLSGLILTSHQHSGLVRKVLEAHGFEVATPPDTGVAQKLCARRQFDLGVYDEDIVGALDFADSSFASKPRIAVGLLAAEKPAQVLGRLHFWLHKPLTSDLLAKTVKAAYGPIAANRRESCRRNVRIKAAECNISHRGELRTLADLRILNLSLTGLCLETAEMLPQGATVELRFTLPESRVAVQLVGTVMWAHASGRGGIKFDQLDSAEHLKLRHWFDSVLSILEEFPAETGVALAEALRDRVHT